MKKVFIGGNGLRAGWRVVLFLLLVWLLSSGAVVLRSVSRDRMAGTAFFALVVFAAAWIMSRIERQPVTAYGLGPVHRWRNLSLGLAAGFLGISLLMGVLRAAGGYAFAPGDIAGAAVWKWAAYWTAFFVLVGFMEEFVTRGYPLFAMAQGMGFWPSAVLLSVVFGLGHLGNPGEQTMGIANAVLAGLVFAFSLRWTGTLWWAIGAHISWDWGETFFYGVANSGGSMPHHFLSGIPAGPAWLSGGTVGPEGSIIAAPALLLLAVFVRFTSLRYEEPALERRRAPVPPAAAPAEIPPPASPPSASPSTYSVDSGDTN